MQKPHQNDRSFFVNMHMLWETVLVTFRIIGIRSNGILHYRVVLSGIGWIRLSKEQMMLGMNTGHMVVTSVMNLPRMIQTSVPMGWWRQIAH